MQYTDVEDMRVAMYYVPASVILYKDKKAANVLVKTPVVIVNLVMSLLIT